MRGKTRVVGTYHAQRGWWDAGIQKVVQRWNRKIGTHVVRQTFIDTRRVFENGTGVLHVEVRGVEHRRFLCELLAALDRLHDPGNCAGWVIKFSGWFAPRTGIGDLRLATYSQLHKQIIDAGGPSFTEDALKKAAKRLRLAGDHHKDEESLYAD
ncbi:MAG: hypothetical protein QOJ40_1760 [Verrucomicrobiota bacterium]